METTIIVYNTSLLICNEHLHILPLLHFTVYIIIKDLYSMQQGIDMTGNLSPITGKLYFKLFCRLDAGEECVAENLQ